MTAIKHIFRPALVALGLAGMASLVSCKDYLNVEATAVDTSEAVFSTTSGAYSAVIGAYAPLAGDVAYGSRISTYFPYDSEDFLNSPTGIDAGDGRRGIARYGSITSNVEVRNPWNALYRGIERANICIKYIPGMDQYKGGSDQAAVQRLYGEALTLRAQYYFELVRNWGDVPAPYEPTVTGADLNLPRTKRNDILDRMIADLDLAAPLVPWRSAATNDERITKGAVKALRARLALYRASYYFDPVSAKMEQAADRQKYYEIVRTECRDLMNNRSEHDLNASFEEPFRSICEYRRDLKNEIMFQVAMGGTANGSSTDSKLGYANGPRVTATSAAFGATTQGSLVAVPTYFYAFDSTDTRRDVTLAPYSIDAGPKRLHTNSVTIYDGKFRREWSSNATLRASAAQGLGYNWPLIRFSDVLLMFAEAQNELAGGPDIAFNGVTARQALMEVRLRGFGGNATRAGVVSGSKAGFFEAVATERNLEFGGEGIRKYDLIRWNRLGSTFQTIKATLNAWTAPGALNTRYPQYIYYTTPTTLGPLQILNSYYKPSATVSAPALTTRVDWITVNATNTSGITTTRINDIASAYTEAHQLLPIPAESINLNPKLTQNPGY
ncbi:RagB/SusD family nutrient uptake outer membrane protein [Hymenobacter ruricola]|uniref:RagB/SusD family nutrient uptake outer membrane protein n=1 Tax=Hymenobacter ruricola TaxID=2791023 RepID=A0ABS0I4B9_9BACT|nr:RagB/SusD family nutrient uptake outer membrane protein [Hymenobacter ruricola]MBF9221801.1 RagB/SusD family nutrient uptake outer membrane protein [Hymenobacter ruricola]